MSKKPPRLQNFFSVYTGHGFAACLFICRWNRSSASSAALSVLEVCFVWWLLALICAVQRQRCFLCFPHRESKHLLFPVHPILYVGVHGFPTFTWQLHVNTGACYTMPPAVTPAAYRHGVTTYSLLGLLASVGECPRVFNPTMESARFARFFYR